AILIGEQWARGEGSPRDEVKAFAETPTATELAYRVRGRNPREIHTRNVVLHGTSIAYRKPPSNQRGSTERGSHMNRTFDWLGGFLLGAAAMSLADPLSGPPRRVFLRGKTMRAFHEVAKKGQPFTGGSPGVQILAGVGGLCLLTTGAVLLTRYHRTRPRTLPDYASLV